ncbi:MAG TPA: hypothetical protein VNV82_20985 [Bryobacteraceae bacterium]|nr:hypothetical protein [Bryobacteraceae bacterium]
MLVHSIGLTLLCAVSAAAAPTFTKDVAPIFYKNCVNCHRPGEIAPMSLLDYQSARPWAKAIREAVATRKMPPWFADPRYGHFSNDTRLKETEIATVKAWVDGGVAQGDPKDLPAPPKFAGGWRFGKPDLVIDIGQDFLVPAGTDLYKDFVVSTNFTEGKWIRAAQVLPGNRRLVHHVHVFVVADSANDAKQELKPPAAERAPALGGFADIEDGLTRVRDDAPVINDACAANANLPNLSGFEEGSLATMLPGKPPDNYDVFGDGSTAKYIPAGAKLRFQIHYAKVDQPGTDRTSVGLYTVAKAPEKPLRRVDLRNRFFLIPAGARNHEVKRCYDVEQDKLLVAITPHMHYRGKDATYELVHASGKREILLVVPHYDFNWQLQYRFEKAVLMEKGSRMEVTFHYDNSPNNPANPEPSKAIRWGDRSEDEMMVTWTETINVTPAESASRATK